MTAVGNIEVTENGLPPLSKEASEAIRTQVIPSLVARVEKDRAVACEQILSGDTKLSQEKLDRIKERLEALRELNVKYGGQDDDIPPPLALSRPQEPIIPRGGGGLNSRRSSENGTERFKERSRLLTSRAVSAPQASVEGSMLPMRAMRFRASITGRPIFGGVVIGNTAAADSERPIRAEILVRTEIDSEGDSRKVPVIHVTARQDENEIDGYWSAATTTELWAAYHIVNPKAEWKLPERRMRDRRNVSKPSGKVAIRHPPSLS